MVPKKHQLHDNRNLRVGIVVSCEGGGDGGSTVVLSLGRKTPWYRLVIYKCFEIAVLNEFAMAGIVCWGGSLR